jgi:hypothetical protein
MHLNDEQIQRLMHGEMDAAARETASRHIAECHECARALAEAEREEAVIFDLLEAVDHEATVVDAARVAIPTRTHSTVWVRRAAGIVVVAALAGAAYAIPGSPLPALVKRIASLMTGPTPPATVDAPTPGAPVTSGIAVPAGENFVIEFASPQDNGSMTVTLTDDTMVRVRAIGGTAAFTTDVGRLDIGNAGSSADYEIELPRRARWIEIRVASTARWHKDGDRVVTDSPTDETGRYRVSLAGARP